MKVDDSIKTKNWWKEREIIEGLNDKMDEE